MDDLTDYQTVFLYRKNWRYTDGMRNKSIIIGYMPYVIIKKNLINNKNTITF